MNNVRKKNRVLVTGGAGFVGSHLCDRLLREGYHVICLDNLRTGSEANLAQIKTNSNFKMLNWDVCDEIDVEVGQIYNLASPASPNHYQSDPIATLNTNVFGANNMLKLAKKQNAKILQASTSEVYGDPQVHPQSEDYNGNVSLTGKRACYDEGKRCAETYFFDYRRQHNVEIKVARIFNTYGPRMQLNDGRVVSNFIVQALRGEDLTVYGDGSQSRSFQYVDDLVDGLYRLMKTPFNVTGPVNLGNPHEQTILNFAETILDLIPQSNSKIVFKDLPEDDPKQRKPNIKKANDLLDWEPTVPLYEGLKRTINYFEKLVT